MTRSCQNTCHSGWTQYGPGRCCGRCRHSPCTCRSIIKAGISGLGPPPPCDRPPGAARRCRYACPRQYWSGPQLRDGSWRGAALAPGAHVGVALTYDASMNLVLGTHPPFRVDANGTVRAPATECTPRLTQELDGLSVDDARAKLASCSADEEAIQKGNVLRGHRAPHWRLWRDP